MKHFKYIILTLFLVGCGVMGSPKETEETTKVDDAGDANIAESTPSFAKAGEINRLLLKIRGELDNKLLAYRLIDDELSLTKTILDLNLSREDNQTLSNVDLNSSYILYYPIKRSSDCGFSDSVIIEQNITKITIDKSLQDCNNMVTYYLPFYRIDKSVIKIEIDAYGERETL